MIIIVHIATCYVWKLLESKFWSFLIYKENNFLFCLFFLFYLYVMMDTNYPFVAVIISLCNQEAAVSSVQFQFINCVRLFKTATIKDREPTKAGEDVEKSALLKVECKLVWQLQQIMSSSKK